MRRLILSICLFLMGPLVACAEGEATTFEEGVHYDRIEVPLRARGAGKIEVVEFFSYGCGHCYNFEPMLATWKKSLPDDVLFVPSPVAWNAGLEGLARAFYTAQALGVQQEMHSALFEAIHRDGKKLSSPGELASLFAAHGVAEADFHKAYNSFGVNSQVGQATSRMRSARITGTPELMVAGKYRITTRKAGSQANMLKVVDYLVEKERAARQP